MPMITFVEPDGTLREVPALAGESLMAAATRANVAGIIGECGGSAMCATCHCYLVSGDLPAPGPLEAETIEFVAQNTRPESRLTCQITATEALEGLVLQVAPR
ncbi:MAG: (2Fe-2S)-binding protein [Rhodobacteraceae bacterium]|nr:(2Fe-2S)-binding protein [Paracoccaceae bacterium]